MISSLSSLCLKQTAAKHYSTFSSCRLRLILELPPPPLPTTPFKNGLLLMSPGLMQVPLQTEVIKPPFDFLKSSTVPQQQLVNYVSEKPIKAPS